MVARLAIATGMRDPEMCFELELAGGAHLRKRRCYKLRIPQSGSRTSAAPNCVIRYAWNAGEKHLDCERVLQHVREATLG
jgi:hypothetical protein